MQLDKRSKSIAGPSKYLLQAFNDFLKENTELCLPIKAQDEACNSQTNGKKLKMIFEIFENILEFDSSLASKVLQNF